MDKLEIVITVLLVCLVALVAYVATSWTLSKNKRWCIDHKNDGGGYKHLQDEEEHAWKNVAKAYAQETMPRITISPVQPRPVFPMSAMPPDEKVSTDDEEEEEEGSQSNDHLDLGRLYFALRYDQHRSMLMVRLIRAEDIPVEEQSLSTYVDVHLLPLNRQSQTFEPNDTTINVSFREVYEFPLSQSDMAIQTLNLHICRYDNYSRRTSVGDVFLALAELSAQGIDITREVFLCRNIISHHEIHRTLGKQKSNLHDDNQDGIEEKEKQRTKPTEKRVAKKVGSRKMWDVLRRAVQSGSYKGAYLPSDSTMHWESIFSQGASSVEGHASVPSSPLKSSEFFLSDPGPTDSPRGDNGEDCGASWIGRQSAEMNFPSNYTDESDIDFPANEQEINEGRIVPFSSPVKHVQLSPAPEEYYQIVPITPFSPQKGKKQATDLSCSWKLPETFTPRDYDVLQTLSHAYKEPRVVSVDSRSRHEIVGGEEVPQTKPNLFGSSASKREKQRNYQKPVQKKTTKLKKREIKSKRIVSSRHSRKMSPRKEPEGNSAEKVICSARGGKFLTSSPLKGKKQTSYQKGLKDLEPTACLSIDWRPASERPEEEMVMEVPSLPEDTPSIQDFPPISSPEEYLTAPLFTLTDFSSITRSQSDPSVDVERFRRIGDSSTEIRRTHSMLEFRDEELAWEEM